MKKFLCGRPAQFDWLVATYHISQGREYRPDPDRERGGIELSGSHVSSPDLKKINQSAVWSSYDLYWLFLLRSDWAGWEQHWLIATSDLCWGSQRSRLALSYSHWDTSPAENGLHISVLTNRINYLISDSKNTALLKLNTEVLIQDWYCRQETREGGVLQLMWVQDCAVYHCWHQSADCCSSAVRARPGESSLGSADQWQLQMPADKFPLNSLSSSSSSSSSSSADSSKLT